MKRVNSRSVATLTLVCIALLAPGCLLGSDTTALEKDPFANWYGRAGGPVGADAISAVSKGASVAPASTQVQWYGRAGTPEGANAIEALSHVTPETLPPDAFEGWYGNAGGPVGVPAATAQDHATPTVEAQKRNYVWEIYGPSVRAAAAGNCVRVGGWLAEAGTPRCETQPELALRRQREAAEAKTARTQSAPEPTPKPAPAEPTVASAAPPKPEATPPAPTPPAQALAQEPAAASAVSMVPAEKSAEQAETPMHVTLDTETHFNFDKFQLKPAGQAKVDQLLAELAQKHYESIVVTGHTDRIGDKEYNETLSERRALSVKRYLARKGVDEKKIQARGVGAAEPVTSPDACEGLDRTKTIQCLAPDRRVELVVVGARAQ